jgi:putative inorganic carbon (HCO3(-)) transporter
MNWPGPASPVFPQLPGGVSGPLSRRVPVFVQRGWVLGVTCLITALFAPLIALTGSARKIFLAIVLLDIPLQVDQNFAYLDDAAELGARGGFNVSLTTFALAGLYGAWLIDRLVHRHRSARVPVGLVLSLLPYMGVAALSLVVAHDAGLYARGLALLVQMFLLYVYLIGTVRTRQDVRFVVSWLLCGLVCEGLIIALSAAGGGFEAAGLQVRTDTFEEEFGTAARFSGTVGSPILAAAYFEMLLAPALAVLGTNLGRYYKTLAVVGLTVGSVALVGTFSRGGWLAAGLSLTIVYFLLWRRRKLSPAVPVVLLVLLSPLALLFHEGIAHRLTGDDGGSARSRVPLMMMAWEIIADQPALGVGANNYTQALEPRTPEFGNEWLFTVHNQYLLVWAETGAVGLAAYLWFLLATLRRGWQRWKRTDPLLAPLALGFTAALMGQMLHMQVDIYSSRPQVQLLFVVAALIGVMSRIDAPHPARCYARSVRLQPDLTPEA